MVVNSNISLSPLFEESRFNSVFGLMSYSKNKEFAKELIGLSVDEAKDKIVFAGFRWHLSSVDGVGSWRTSDYRVDSINLDVEANVVKDARVG